MHFIDTGVPIYVHDLELTNALWCLFTKVSGEAGIFSIHITHRSTGRCWTIPAVVSNSSSQLADVQ